MIKAIDFSMWNGLPPEQEWVIKDWLAIGSVSSLCGERGTNKSFLVQELITALATGQHWLDTSFEPAKVYGVFSEIDENELLTRQHRVHTRLSRRCPHRIKMVSLFGKENLLMNFDNNNVGILTHLFDELLSDIESFNPKLVVLDEVSGFFGGDENNSSHVKQFVQKCCAHIARKVNCAVLLCKHGLIETGVWRDTMKFHMYAYPGEEGSSYLVNYISHYSKQK